MNSHRLRPADRRLIRLLIVFLPSSVCFTSLQGQEKTDFGEPLRVIEAWMEAQKDYDNIPGISAGIVKDQQLIWHGVFGYSDPSLGNKTNKTTMYSICSISKLFTAIAVMQLRDQGKFDLDDNISEYLPWFNLKQSFPESPSITIRSLLTHSSGVPRDSDYPYWADPSFPFPTPEEFCEKLGEQETLYPASTIYQYSNLGMSLLGFLVEEVSGTSYQDYVSENILLPLGLDNTFPYMPESLRKGRLATGYSVISRNGKRDELDFFQTKGIAPAAGFVSTVEDLARFTSWQFRIREKKQDPVLNGNTLLEMQRVHWVDPDWSNTRGLGFGIYRTDKVTMVGHYGSCPGFLSQLKMIPSQKLGFIVMINCQGVDSYRFVEAMYSILHAYLKSEDLKPEVPFNPEEYSGIYYDFWDGESIIIPWKGNLAVYSLRNSHPGNPLTVMKHTGGDQFRRIKKDGSLGARIRFERNEEGMITKYWIHSFYMVKKEAEKQ
jgi:CubicO group peptidase (beta-lactamase class C family)